MAKSITVKELIEELKKQPQDWPVFAGTDPEGNSYGGFDKNYMVGGSNEDKVVVLYPIETYDDEDIMPLSTAEIMATIKKEISDKENK